MDFAGRRHTKSGNEQTAANDNQEDGGKQLNSWFVFANFHCKVLCMWRIICNFVYSIRETKLI